MHRPLQDYLDELETAGSAKQLCQAMVRIAAGMDLPAFAYIAIPSATGRQLRLINNYADPWRRHYVDRRYEICNPIVLHSIRQPRPFGRGETSEMPPSHTDSSMRRPTSASAMATPSPSIIDTAGSQP